jgi:hypothetical protein
MASDYIVTRAQDFTEALTATLPHLQFQAYVPLQTTQEICDLYIFGFITVDVLVGGYCITEEQVKLDFNTHLLSMSQFFRRAGQGDMPRFHPTELNSMYEAHRNGKKLWRRVA